MTRNFYQEKNNKIKTWSITVTGTQLTTVQEIDFGEPKQTQKNFSDPAFCTAEADKLIHKKIEDGFEEVLLHLPGVRISVLRDVLLAQEGKISKLEIYDAGGSEALMNLICSITSLEQLLVYRVASVPVSIGQLKNLQSLTISNSLQLIELPDAIGELTALTSLSIGETGISMIPDSIGNLTNLRYLTVSSNRKLKKLPNAIGKLTSLWSLTAFYNRSRDDQDALEIPEEIGQLSKLERLSLSANNLRSVPNSFGNLHELDFLELDQNPALTEIPSFVLRLTKLYLLSMEECPVTSIPAALCSLPELEVLRLRNHAITDIPEQVIEEGWPDIKLFLEGNYQKKAPKEPENPYEQLAKEYRTVHGTVLPIPFSNFILDGSLSNSKPFLFKGPGGQSMSASFITDICMRMDGMADQLIRITVAELAQKNEPVGFAFASEEEGDNEYDYQLVIFPTYNGHSVSENDVCPVYLVKFKGYPDEEFDEDDEEYQDEDVSKFECSIEQVADSFENFLRSLRYP